MKRMGLGSVHDDEHSGKHDRRIRHLCGTGHSHRRQEGLQRLRCQGGESHTGKAAGARLTPEFFRRVKKEGSEELPSAKQD
jgi:hypothetical protein